MKAKISKHTSTPKDKFAFPQTANQELGWFSDKVIKHESHKINILIGSTK